MVKVKAQFVSWQFSKSAIGFWTLSRAKIRFWKIMLKNYAIIFHIFQWGPHLKTDSQQFNPYTDIFDLRNQGLFETLKKIRIWQPWFFSGWQPENKSSSNHKKNLRWHPQNRFSGCRLLKKPIFSHQYAIHWGQKCLGWVIFRWKPG